MKPFYFFSTCQLNLAKMPVLHCELEHTYVVAVSDIMFLKFLKTDKFRAINGVFLQSSKEYFVRHSICSSMGATLGTGNSFVSMTKTWLMD